MEEYGLSQDEPIATDSRQLHSSRRDYRPYSKRDWIAAIKKGYKRDEQVFAGFLQEKHQQLYHQGTWLFGNWDKYLKTGQEQTPLGKPCQVTIQALNSTFVVSAPSHDRFLTRHRYRHQEYVIEV